MNARAELQSVQSALIEHGVRDVKFCFAQLKGVPMSHVQTDVTDALRAFKEKAMHPLKKANDSRKK